MDNYYILKIICKNPQRFIGYLHNIHIDIYNIKYIDDGLIIKVIYQDYLKILKIKTSYKIEIIDVIGTRKILWAFKNNKLFLSFFAISILLIILISNIIFKIEYIDVSQNIKDIISQELKNYKVEVFTLKKSYKQLNIIKEKIKENHEEIEWMELTNDGVKLMVKAIERKDEETAEKGDLADIVAKKDGFLISIMAKTGEVIKNPGDYVKKGDIIISGTIKNKENTVNIVSAKGKVYAEVWYIVSLEKSLIGSEQKYGDKAINQYVFYIFGKRISFSDDRYSLIKEKKIINSKMFQLVKEYRREIIETKVSYTQKDIVALLEKEAEDKINKQLDADEFIMLKKTLKKQVENGKMKIEVFFKVKEEIGIGKKIDMVE